MSLVDCVCRLLAALRSSLVTVAGWGVRVTCCSRIKFGGAFPYQLLCVAVQFQGPIYTHSENPAPLPPQGMIVQPEMHLPHPGEEPAPQRGTGQLVPTVRLCPGVAHPVPGSRYLWFRAASVAGGIHFPYFYHMEETCFPHAVRLNQYKS